MTLRPLALSLLVAACSSSYQRPCQSDANCDDLECHRIEELPFFCSDTCGVSEDCRAAFGEASYCSVAAVCMESCVRDEDCPHDGRCAPEGYCISHTEGS